MVDNFLVFFLQLARFTQEHATLFVNHTPLSRSQLRYAYLRGIRVVPQIDVPGHSSGLIPLKPRGLAFCRDTPIPSCSTSHCQVQVSMHFSPSILPLFPSFIFLSVLSSSSFPSYILEGVFSALINHLIAVF
jgi:hypothetical protein